MSLRELAEQQIIKFYKAGIKEINVDMLNYDREDGKKLIPQYLENGLDWKMSINPEFNIEEFVKELTDEEILEVMDSQACYKYR